ncbi:tetratricopeptide repeat-containing protein-like protein [Corchorus olitorius]|uniref:Tetratricopeptide repeat-containing protein-like protein n=1 Tax=Corchorus olitorius TaxID=93759 RepID=A0A1R3KYZ0_9ROSI|nr:tetratricopeptide repeat-containing protein-like protein [Corchorus olitorius]
MVKLGFFPTLFLILSIFFGSQLPNNTVVSHFLKPKAEPPRLCPSQVALANYACEKVPLFVFPSPPTAEPPAEPLEGGDYEYGNGLNWRLAMTLQLSSVKPAASPTHVAAD